MSRPRCYASIFVILIQQNPDFRNSSIMEGKIINDRYKAIRELKEARDGKIYYVVEDIENGKRGKLEGNVM